ncbi:MAG: outer membrane protein assembly factor BamB family protein [Ktedonobacteraceae bacterium]
MQRISREISSGGWIFAGVLFLLISMSSFGLSSPTVYATGGDWPTYQFDIPRSGFNTADTILNPSSASQLTLHWTDTTKGVISAQPVEANNMIYWGSWSDGLEHATDLNNNSIWETPLGTTTDSRCYPSHAGVASTATVATINGQSMLFVGGGNATFYALDAATGSIIWSTPLGSSPSHFLWSSPALFNVSIYEGVASFGDCPLVQGQMVQLDPASGAITNIFDTVPTGCIGGGVTGSPTIDEAAGTLYFATGNAGSCGSYESDTTAIVELNASDLSFVGAWQVPASQRGDDSDFLSTPTLFTSSGGTPMVGVANKNGVFYAFQRDALSNGPVWQTQIAIGGDCPLCGEGSISPAGWDGNTLYVAGGRTTIGGTHCKGSVNALNPDNGSFLWQRCFTSGVVLGPVAVVPGVLVVGQGNRVVVLATASGQTLYHFVDTTNGSVFYGGASISNGVIYIGNKDGRLFAIGT